MPAPPVPPSLQSNVNATKVEYVQLGSSGLRVSSPILGTMAIGSKAWQDWVMEENEGLEILKAAWDRGLSTWDTANVYSSGINEEIIGKAIRKFEIPRHKLTILAKCYGTVPEEPSIFNWPFEAQMRTSRDYINQGGLSRSAIFKAVDASLKRLDTDYIDLLQIHRYDASVPPEETMKALHDLVQAGKVHYIGASSMWTFQFARMQFIAEKNGWTKFVSMQNCYNLFYREEEREMNKFCDETGVGLIPWGPLASGLLAKPLGVESARSKISIAMSGGLTEADGVINKRCDEARPTCNRCQKANLICYGGGTIGKFVFLSENEYATGRRTRPRGPNVKTVSNATENTSKAKFSDPESNSRSQENALLDRKLPTGPQRLAVSSTLASPQEDQALAYYSRHHIDVPYGWPGIADRWDDHLKYALEEWSCSRHDSVLSLAILAVSLVTLGRARQDYAALAAGSRKYSKALTKTNMALTSVREASSDDVLLAVMLLSFYENAVMDKNSYVSSEDIEAIGSQSFAHHDGAIAMLKLRRQLNQRTDRSVELDKLVRRQLMRTLLLRSMSVPSWLRDGSQFGEHGLAFDLDCYMVRTAEIRHQASNLWADYAKLAISDRYNKLPRIRRLLADTQSLDTVLTIWADRLPTGFRYSTHPVQYNEYAWTNKRIFDDTVHIYPTVGHAGAWDRYRSIRLILNDLMLKNSSLLTQSSVSDTGPLEEATRSRIHCLLNDLCASVPYVFGLIESPSVTEDDVTVVIKVPATLKESCKASTASSLCWPLYEAIMISGISERHHRYLKERILDVSEIVDDGIMGRLVLDPSIYIPPPPMGIEEVRARLRTHFDVHTSQHPDRWAQLWTAGDFLPWDKGTPNPALIDLLDQRKDLIGDCFVEDAEGTGTKRRKRALVPGCGGGYDVLLLASYGYDAYGLEVSEKAIERCIEEQKANGDKYPVKDEAVGAGRCMFLKGDFFEDGWSKAIAAEGTFELIYDYTFLCALNPSMRPAWALRMSQLLSRKPPGHLICLEYPTYKESSTGGPPFGLTPQTYVEHLSHPGEEVPYDEAGQVEVRSQSQPSSGSLERIDHWQPERTHETGKGTDWMSVWRHR
ncbi:MAG: hypothetical protein Q9225_002335 [Loekoesia sp. 1 TL-2023]